MEKHPTPLLVVAVALVGADGRVLMHRRRMASNHGGLWEFPGGKVEPGETPQIALFREIEEELGVALDLGRAEPAAFATSDAASLAPGNRAIVILLYTCRAWHGEPQCLEGEEIGWFAPSALARLAMPPLDYPLAAELERRLAGKPI